MCFF
jgi:hypothetical protein